MKSNSAIYQGLFLIAFALYASERVATRERVTPVTESAAAVARPILESSRLDQFYSQLQATQVFQKPVDGLTLIRNPKAILIRFQSDELYREGEVAMNETWFSLLDRVGKAIFSKWNYPFKLNFIGYANAQSETESLGVAFQQSPYVFSLSRAEWLFRYYESQYKAKIHKPDVLISGAAPVSNGKKVEIKIEED